MTTPLSGELAAFTEQLSFTLDDFQQRACRALEDGHGVLVCAPTGAGKTVVGEFAVHLALAAGRKCFYTTPIKALSNQKHADLVRRYGQDRIGLLTGDQSINGDAPIVVMTTEVLRNMLYANSDTLHGLSHVVMDEVHFLADRMRGAVWEEVILHLSEDVRLVSLSATVSNAEEFGGWIQTVRGDTTVVVDEHRPVPLWQHVMVGKRLFDLFDYRAGGPTKNGRELLVDPQLLRHIAHRREADRLAEWRPRDRRGGHRGRPSIFRGPSRPDVIELLEDQRGPAARHHLHLLPGRLRRRGQTMPALLAAAHHRRRARPHRRGRRPPVRRPAPNPTWSCSATTNGATGLLRGLAAHHAGMLPAFRHTVEELFTQGLVKAVFATETLALGINMPARTVVLERLVKFDGEQHVQLTPGEYTQLTGRAGRRGIDVEGHAVVLWTPDVDPAEVAGLASTRTFPLRSSFAPSYNMTINLVNQMGPTQAHKLLESSFAQYQADRSVVGLVRGIERGEKMLDEIAAEIGGRDGPILAYARLRAQISQREKAQSRASRLQRRRAVNDALSSLRRGDIVNLVNGRRAGLAVVLEPARDEDDPRPLVLTENRWAGRISSADYSGESAKVGSMTLPKRVEHRQPRVRRDLASALRSATEGMSVPKGRRSGAAARSRRRSRTQRASRRAVAPPRSPPAGSRGEGPARRAIPAHRTRQRADPAEGGGCDELAGANVRPDRRAAHRARLHPRRQRRSEGHRRRQDACPHLQRKRPACRRMPSWRRVGGPVVRGAGGSAFGGALRVTGRFRRPRRPPRSLPASCAARWPTPAGCPPSYAPTSSGTGSRRAASPTRAS